MKLNHSTTQPLNHSRLPSGFTLVEMLVVIGMIGILAATLIASFSNVKTAAKQSQSQSQVSEVATAFNLYLQQERQWPEAMLDDPQELDAARCAIFQKLKLLDLTTWTNVPSISQKGVVGTDGTLNKNSPDRFGMLDPWGRAAMRKNPTMASANTSIEGGTKLSQHLIQYRLDKNYDGYVDSSEGAPKGRVRASVLVWSRGPDGKDASTQAKRYPGDDRLSWSSGSAVKDK